MKFRERRRLTIIHPYVPEYRFGFYERLQHSLGEQGFELRVLSGAAPPSLSDRNDSVGASWTYPIQTRWFRLLNKEVAVRSLSSVEWSESDFVVVEQAIKNLETYRLMLEPGYGAKRVAMWGHGRTFSSRQARFLRQFKVKVTNRAEWFFAYTDEGAQYVIERGFPSDRVTTLNNTIDTDSLHRDLQEARSHGVEALRHSFDLVPGKTALFIGGVDENKGIRFLLDAAGLAHRQDSEFRLLVAGDGALAPLVKSVDRPNGPIRYVGRATGAFKARLLAVADILAIPEWIGLVAVDSLVAGVPIVSTRSTTHSPECSYLLDGITSVFVEHDIAAYAQALNAVLGNSLLRTQLARRSASEGVKYGLQDFVENFVSGVCAWSSMPRR